MTGLQDTFYRCFIEDNRWCYLTKGLGNTLLITFFALLIGVVIGTVVGIICTSSDKNSKDMHPGLSRTLLKLANAICKIYLAVIRGTPVVVQLLLGIFVILIALGNDIVIALSSLVLIPVLTSRRLFARVLCRLIRDNLRRGGLSVSVIYKTCGTSLFLRR